VFIQAAQTEKKLRSSQSRLLKKNLLEKTI